MRGSFGMLSDYRLFTCGTRGIMFHSPRGPAPFALTNVGKIAVFAFNPVNDACYFFSSDRRSFDFLKTELDNFHRHLNAVNPHIQFSVERATPMDGKPTIAFLDTNVSTLPNGEVEVQVYRKATHTNKYLAFDSHHPAQHKRSVVGTLMRRAKANPSSEALRTEETSHVQDSLQVNGYPTKFIINAA